MQKQHNNKDERTTPMGLFNYAHSYFSSAKILSKSKPDCTHPTAPTNYLFAHALELYLKSFLRNKGVSINELKKISHNTQTLIDRSLELDLKIHEVQRDQINLGCESLQFRYIITGFRQMLTYETYASLCVVLHNQIGPQIYKNHKETNLLSAFHRC